MLCARAVARHSCRSLRLALPLNSKASELGDDGMPKDYKLKTIRVGSRRLDTFISRATGKSSSQAEKTLLGGKVRVNEESTTKKAYQLQVQREDVIDVWTRAFPDNSQLAEVERNEIVDYEISDSGYLFEVKSWKKILVDNWRGSNK